MLKFAGSIVAGGVLGGASLLASDSNNVFLPAVVATVGFVGAMSLFSSLEQPVAAAAEAVTAPTQQSKAAKKAAAAKREKKAFVKRDQAPTPKPEPEPEEQDEEEEEEAEEPVEEVKAAPKKKNKKKKAAAAAPEPPKEEKKVEKKKGAAKSEAKVPIVPVIEKKEEKKGKAKKAAAPEPVAEKKEEKKGKKAAAAPVEEKKAEKKGEKKGEKKEEKKAAPKKAAPVEEKKGKKTEEKKGKKEEKKAKKPVESDEDSPSADEDEGFTLVKSSSRKKSKDEPLTEDELAKPVTQEIKISAKAHGVIIGPNGDTLRLVQESTGARISMPKRESGSETVVITGPLSAVQEAKVILKDLEVKGFSSVTHPGQQSGELMLKEDKDKGLLIGPGGAHLRAIQNATNTRITMPAQNTVSLKVIITGSKDNVKRAKQEIKALIAEGYSALTHPNWIKKEIPFPKDQLRTLIGKKGQNIKHIQGVSKGARINTSGGDDVVTVVGTPEQVAIAEKEIMRLVAPPEEVAPAEGWGAEAEYNEDDAWA